MQRTLGMFLLAMLPENILAAIYLEKKMISMAKLLNGG